MLKETLQAKIDEDNLEKDKVLDCLFPSLVAIEIIEKYEGLFQIGQEKM